MPLVTHTSLPTYEKLRRSGCEVLAPEDGARSSAPEIRIGLLNMMPDAALAAVELQFMRLIGRSTLDARFFTHVFSLPYLRRSPAARAYIERHYETFAEVRRTGLDALIITGANVSNPTLEIEPFWRPLQEVIDWAGDAVSSTLCSCLATHALLKHLHGIDRHRLPRKLWGVYSHRARDRRHPLLKGIESDFPVPHSRFNDVRADEIEAAGLSVLADSETAGVHLAVSADQRGIVFFQGHPEYQAITLLKEYKREVLRYLNREIDARPPFPENYFSVPARHMLNRHVAQALEARDGGGPIPRFPEDELAPGLENRWADAGQVVFNNWLGIVERMARPGGRDPCFGGVVPKTSGAKERAPRIP